ncbi:hypothetical protein Dimus_004356 [Dionaea muscipula]
MIADPQISVHIDPLACYSTLSLFLPRALKPSTADHKSVVDNIDAIHACFEAMELRSPRKLLNQAKTILEAGTGSGGSGTSLKIYEDKNEGVAAEGVENPHHRRPSLGRKRAQFSLLSNPSEPLENFKPSLNIDVLEDPEKYFSEIEKLEKAEKEIRRQRGIAMTDLDQNAPPANGRRRRPSLLGKLASYTHRYSTCSIDDENSHIPFQETLIQGVSIPSGDSFPPETADPDVSSQGLKQTVEDQVTKVLDDLLSRDDEELHGDKALNLLQERLNIKPIELSKICLPELHDLRKSIPERSGKALQMLQHQSSRSTFIKSNAAVENCIPRASPTGPTPPENPLASTSLLKRRMSQFNPTKEPLSCFKTDPSYARSMCEDQIDEQSYKIDEGDEVRNSDRLVHRKEGTIVESEESRDLASGTLDPSDIHKEDEPKVSCLDGYPGMESGNDMIDINIISNGGFGDEDLGNIDQPSELVDQVIEVEFVRSDHAVQDPDMQKTNGCITEEPNFLVVGQEMTNGPSTRSVRCNELSTENHEASKLKSSRGKGKGQLCGHSSKAVRGKAESQSARYGKRKRKEHVDEKSLNGSIVAAIYHMMEEPSSMQGGENRQATDNEQTSDVSVDGRVERNVASDVRLKSKEHDGRKSLAAAGTKWESGVRRSTRIKTRPLKYWKGERFLYGRIHNTMVTVIGLKYFSPSKDGGQPKVASYVPDEYKDLVELAALH